MIISNYAYANGKILKSGFFTKSASVEEGMDVKDPKNKIIIIYNHGQNSNDKAHKNECIWVNQIRNQASLVDEEINGKKIMVYNFCSNDFAGDMSLKKHWWKSKTPYVGKHKLDKRIEKNLELVEKFISIGVPRKQIIISGHSCGGLLTLMLLSAYPEKVGGGISYMQACFGKLSKTYKVKKVGVEEALKKFKEKEGPGPANMRQMQIDEIKKSPNLPVLVFTHPKDPFGGLVSDWVEEVSGVERIVISQNNKVNEKSCNVWGKPIKNYHDIDRATCFKEYNPKILDFIASKIN